MTLGSRRQGRILVAAALFVVAAWMRWADLDSPGTLVERDFCSRILARWIYFSLQPPDDPWRAEVARVSAAREGLLEPPITETLVAVGYRLGGAERPWLSRVLCSMFWLAGGIFVYRLARRRCGAGASLASMGFYLLAPLGVVTSRSFQPDALMILAAILSLHANVRLAESTSPGRLLWAIAIGSFAVLVKPMIVFWVLLAYAVPRFVTIRWRMFLERSSLAYATVVLLPALAWYASGALDAWPWQLTGSNVQATGQAMSSSMAGQLKISLALHRPLELSFWIEWAQLAWRMVGQLALPLGLLGLLRLLAAPTSPLASVIWGACLSYPLFGLASSRLIGDHGYYHAQLLPLVALGLGPALAWLWGRIPNPALSGVVAVAALVAWGAKAERRLEHDLHRARIETVQVSREIGELVGHSTRTVYVARHYGRVLEYHGELSGVPWPMSTEEGSEVALGVEERIARLGFEPEYFIVTHFELFERYHQPLSDWLQANGNQIADDADYRIWRYRSPGSS